jgi:hypothetical protein
MAKYRLGQLVKVSPKNDNECYDDFRGKTLKITNVATCYMQHPGYDPGMEGEGLYDFIDAETGEEINFSLYDYELIKA